MIQKNTWQGFMQSCSSKGFTLIELLVVVLIIGILAAIAVPQYQKAVMKSRYAKLRALATSVFQAQEVYYLANGDYAADIDALDVAFPDSTVTHQYDEGDTQVEAKEKRNRYYEWGACYTIKADYSVVCKNDEISMGYYMYFKNRPDSWANKRRCDVFTTNSNSVQAQICQSETGDTAHGSSGHFYYWYQ